MFKQKRLTVLSLAVMFALLMAAVLPMSALADDGVPPQPEAPVVVEEEPVVEEPDAEEPVVEEPAAEEPVVEEPAAEEPVVEEPAAEEPTVAEVLAEVPAGTDVVVLDENGEALPLASAEAAETILVSDPVYCEAGFTPADAANCTASFATMYDLNAAGIGALATGGTIYFTAGNYVADPVNETGELVWDPAGTVGGTTITLQGGWNGTVGAGSALLGTQTVFALPVVLTGWTGNVTLNNITVTGVNSGWDSALQVETTGDVFMNMVEVTNNTVDTDGLVADTSDQGAYVEANDVTINNSIFNSNQSAGSPGEFAGLVIEADGNVSLNNVTANYNKGDGANISGGATQVTVSNSVFNFNTSDAKNPDGDPYGDGLWMSGIKGDITLNNVSAMYNSYNGVEVGSKSNEGKSGNGTTGNIIVNGGNFQYNGFGKNGGDGLHLSADKNITLNGIRSWGNYDDGAEVCAGGDVNLNGNMFYYNGYGVYLRCAQNVNSNYNYWWNQWWSSYWYNWYGNYYGTGDYYYSGYYDGFYYDGWALPIWGGPNITINNIYVDGYFIPNYNSYYSFFNSYYYGYGWNNWDYNERGPGWRWWGWNWGWLYRGYPFQGTVTTKPMTAELTPLTEDELPGELPEGKTFANAFEAEVSDGVPGEVTKVFFEVPAGFADGDTLTVLSWNEKTETWDEVESTVEDGKVNFKTGTSGIFALVTP